MIYSRREQAAKIRIEYTNGEGSCSDLASRHNLCVHSVQRIVRNEVHRDVNYRKPTPAQLDEARIAYSKVNNTKLPRSRLGYINWEMVREIRRLYITGEMTNSELCLKFQLSRTTVRDILINEGWKDNDYRVPTSVELKSARERFSRRAS